VGLIIYLGLLLVLRVFNKQELCMFKRPKKIITTKGMP